MADDQYTPHRISSWDNNNLARPSESTRYTQNPLSVPMLPKNYNLPRTVNGSQVYPQYGTDEQQLQKYQQPTKTDSGQAGGSKSFMQHITITRVIGLLVGLIVTGVPLAVIITLYVQLSTSSSNTTSNTASSTTISTSILLPSQCTSYTPINDATRLVSYTSCTSSCDNGMSGWYRVTGSSGTRLVSTPPSINSCGNYYPAWYNGSHPTTPGATASGIGCVNYNGNICYSPYSSSLVLATNCNGFYVYYLTPLSCFCCSGCYYPRYCTQ